MAEKKTSAAKTRAKLKDADLKKARTLIKAGVAIDALSALVQQPPTSGEEETLRYYSEIRRLVTVAYRPAMRALQDSLIQEGWTKEEIAAADKIAMPKAKTRGAKHSRKQ